MTAIETILSVLGIYLALGFVFAIPFLVKGILVIDEDAHQSGWGFRLIISPGVMMLWPLLLKKWINSQSRQHHE